MLKHLAYAMVAFALAVTPVLAAAGDGTATYDLLFKEGTLDDVPMDHILLYERSVTNTLLPEAGPRDTGELELSFEETTPPEAALRFLRDGKHRNLGVFPMSVGNPIIMYFVETTVRDMAESAGGSPFYIRNRVKEALITPTEVQTGEAIYQGKTVQTQIVTLHPFAEDPNRDRMQGFGDLALTVTMSDEVPGWYQKLEATATGSDGPVYSSVMAFDKLEEAPQ
ncbi:hypothetical protein P775_04660 [Puniceibacterium antarcticum]|uniref:Uncharacterized protein n=1 Tax=Puniceibacterium antarcticum TaxID=1206336 RepID=A0A2G8RIE7_9RHOB|nr:hypothetical protein [Puniceibacterium antarcticum]PIL21282.1 hypothetical protein P775_04660 [Puniceibacterium antarcticum]